MAKRKTEFGDEGRRPGHKRDSLKGPGRGAGTEFQSRPWGGDRGNVHGHLPGGMKGERLAPKKMTKVPEEINTHGYSDYSTNGRLNNHVEEGGEHDPLPVSYHRNSGTSSKGDSFRGRRM